MFSKIKKSLSDRKKYQKDVADIFDAQAKERAIYQEAYTLSMKRPFLYVETFFMILNSMCRISLYLTILTPIAYFWFIVGLYYVSEEALSDAHIAELFIPEILLIVATFSGIFLIMITMFNPSIIGLYDLFSRFTESALNKRDAELEQSN